MYTHNLNCKKYSETCVRRPLSKRYQIGFQDELSLDAGQKCSRMLLGEHSAILSTFIKLQFVIKIFVLSTFEWLFYTGDTVHKLNLKLMNLMCRSTKSQLFGPSSCSSMVEISYIWDIGKHYNILNTNCLPKRHRQTGSSLFVILPTVLWL